MINQWIISLTLGIVSRYLQSMGFPSLVQFMVVLGKTFGPNGCRHFSELALVEQQRLLQRVPALNNTHTDWPKPFQWVSRSFTAFVTIGDNPPPIIAGNGTTEDIPEPGAWVATRGYFAATMTTKLHVRFGWRWDVNGKYLEFPAFTVKYLK